MDAKLRQLERIAFSTEDNEDVLRYWRACLRAGELPKPSRSYKLSEYWILHTEPQNITIVLDKVEFRVALYGDTGVGPKATWHCRTKKESLEKVREALETVVGWFMKENPDDDIRKLERQAFTTFDSQDIAAYWKASLRAGRLPKPNRVLELERKEVEFWGLGNQVIARDTHKKTGKVMVDLLERSWPLKRYFHGSPKAASDSAVAEGLRELLNE